MRKFLHEETNCLLQKGYIVRSNSEWACFPVVALKANGELRFCRNYQPVNKKGKKSYPLPNMRSILSQLHETKIISTIDVSEVFHQFPMDEESRKYTAFVVEGLSQFEWLRMPNGLTGAPSTFQRLMDIVVKTLKNLVTGRNLPPQWINQMFTIGSSSVRTRMNTSPSLVWFSKC